MPDPEEIGAYEETIRSAWEALGDDDLERAQARAHEVIALAPDCVDARTILAEIARRRGDATEALRQAEEAVTAGEGLLSGTQVENPWMDFGTRPFMRALMTRARAARDAADLALAEETLAMLLDLNPRDDQGARFLLCDLLTGSERHQDVIALTGRYPDETEQSFLENRLRAEEAVD